MAIKSAKYYKVYLSQTSTRDIISYPGSPIMTSFQKINEEDKKLRNEIIKIFGFHEDEDEYEGFDGKIFYSYKIRDNLSSSDENTKNIEYKTKVLVKKTGYEN